MRSCKFIKCTRHHRAAQLRLLTVFVFFVGDTLPPPDTPIDWFQHVTQIILALDNQNNAIRGKNVSHFRLECPSACPIRSGHNIFLGLQGHGCDPTATDSNYRTPQGLRSVSTSNIISVMRAGWKRVGAARLGFTPKDIVTYSLRSGGATTMHIAGVPYRTLMDIGWWHSLGFLVYIQQQISSFSTGVSVRMSAQPWFRNL